MAERKSKSKNSKQRSLAKKTRRTNKSRSLLAKASKTSPQTIYTTEYFRARHRKTLIFTILVLVAGCAVLGLLYYQTAKNLNSTKNNLLTVKHQNNTLQSQLKAIQVAEANKAISN